MKAVWRRRTGVVIAERVAGEVRRGAVRSAGRFSGQFVVGLVAGSMLAVAACSPAKPSGAVIAAASPSATASLDPGAVAEREALAAYAGMWLAMAKAGEVPDPDAPELRRYAADEALAAIVGALVTYREAGLVLRGTPITNAHITGANPAEAPTEVMVADCGDSTSWTTHNQATGEMIKDDPRGRRYITAVIKPIAGFWKVVSFEVGDIGSC